MNQVEGALDSERAQSNGTGFKSRTRMRQGFQRDTTRIGRAKQTIIGTKGFSKTYIHWGTVYLSKYNMVILFYTPLEQFETARVVRVLRSDRRHVFPLLNSIMTAPEMSGRFGANHQLRSVAE